MAVNASDLGTVVGQSGASLAPKRPGACCTLQLTCVFGYKRVILRAALSDRYVGVPRCCAVQHSKLRVSTSLDVSVMP